MPLHQFILKIETPKMDTIMVDVMGMSHTTDINHLHKNQHSQTQHKNQHNQDTTTRQQSKITTIHVATAEDAGLGKTPFFIHYNTLLVI